MLQITFKLAMAAPCPTVTVYRRHLFSCTWIFTFHLDYRIVISQFKRKIFDTSWKTYT